MVSTENNVTIGSQTTPMSISQRLYPNLDDNTTLLMHCSNARFVYDLGLEQRNLWRKDRTAKINYPTQAKELAEARQAFTWLKEGSSAVQQQALRDLDKAFKNWWNNPAHFFRPTWRKAGDNEGFYVRDLSVRKLNRNWGEILVPRAEWVKFRITRNWNDIETASSARVTKDRSGRWFVSFTRPAPQIERESTGAIVGLDMGIASSVTTSDGMHLHMPKLLSPAESQRKRRLQRKLSSQQKGSNSRARTKLSIAKLAAKESDRRKDWVEKTTTQLVRNYDLNVLEHLKVKNMVRSASGTKENPGKNVAQKKGLNREILNQSWSFFRKRLKDKANSSGVVVTQVNPKYTSQTCSVCKHCTRQNRKSQAVFSCVACGYQADADINAAQNILAAGLAVTGCGGTPQALSHSDPMKRQPLEEEVA
ncbi:MAG: IS200/IS605 family element transposase accessory protein TnpB [Acidimicrobiaceae bacterium]|nr:IS200/IS605 family element transposase accessory protein TnpB [Acidimicrobiaceae bacterium]